MSLSHLDGLLNVLDQLGEEEDRSGKHVLLGRSTLQVHLRFIRMLKRWEKSDPSHWFFERIDAEVTNAFSQILHPYETRDYDEMCVIVGNLLVSIGTFANPIINFCRSCVRNYEHGLVCGDLNQEFVDPLVENMSQIISSTWTCPLTEQLQVLQRRLGILGNCTANLATYQGKLAPNFLEDAFSRMKIICQATLFVCCVCWWEKNHINFEILVADVLVKIQDYESYLRCAYSCDFQVLGDVDYLLTDLEGWTQLCSSSSATIQVATLVKELSFLRDFLLHPTEHCSELGGSDNLLTHITSSDEEVSTVVLSIPCTKPKQGVAEKLKIMVSDLQKCCRTRDISELEISDELYLVITELLNRLYTMKAEIRQCFIPENISRDFPRTLTLGYVDFFLQNLEELVRHRGDFLDHSLKHESETLLSELQMLRHSLKNALEQPKNKNVEGLKLIKERMVNLAYKAEFHVDFLTVGSRQHWFHILSLYDVVDSVKYLNAQINQICETTDEPRRDGFPDAKEVGHSDVLFTPLSLDDEELVGFVDEAGKISNRLYRGSKSLDIVSIVGMPGLGKTTLAQKLYKSHNTTTYFKIRSWCCVSQVYTRRRLLLDILDDAIELDAVDIRRMSDDDLAEMLCKSLKGRRYLIVLDDIWGVDAWSDIRCCFPDQANGSRILLTSRSELVSLEIKPNGSPFNLRMFSNEESWQLLQKKLFGASSCPSGLSDIGENIAEYCRGLPLSVVVVAGILKDVDQSADQWNLIAESVKQHSFDEDKKVMGILEVSYQQLPSHLKPCFLYFGIFPEDREISVQKLVSLWIAEGLVLKIKGISAEDVGESYVKELVGRSLVMIAKRKSKGGIKACNIHDLLLQFCLEKGKEENFLLLSHGNEATFTSWNGSDLQSDCASREDPLRICIHACQEDLQFWRPYNYPHFRSLLFFANAPGLPDGPDYFNDFSFLVHCTNLLRVLDLGQFKINDGFPHGFESLVHLRYLAVRGRMRAVPASIANLFNLETLLVKGMRGEVSAPQTIWKLRRLKHLLIRGVAAFKFSEDDGNTSGIESIATPALCYGDVFTRDLLTKFPRLRKLRCVFLEWGDVYEGGRRFKSPLLDCLSELESLKVVYQGSVRYDFGEFYLPRNLKKLTLTKFRLPWSVISQIGGRLPNLEVLKLLFKSFVGDTWDVSDGEFPSLKFLKLDSLDIAQWNACTDSFHRLERLVLQRCKNLKSIPCEIGDLDTLQTIEIYYCSSSAAESAQMIHQGQLDLGNNDLQLHIHAPAPSEE